MARSTLIKYSCARRAFHYFPKASSFWLSMFTFRGLLPSIFQNLRFPHTMASLMLKFCCSLLRFLIFLWITCSKTKTAKSGGKGVWMDPTKAGPEKEGRKFCAEISVRPRCCRFFSFKFLQFQQLSRWARKKQCLHGKGTYTVTLQYGIAFISIYTSFFHSWPFDIPNGGHDFTPEKVT